MRIDEIDKYTIIVKNSCKESGSVILYYVTHSSITECRGYKMDYTIYRLAVFLLIFFPAEKVDEFVSDYVEYLDMKDPSRQTDSPWEFLKPSFERKSHILIPRIRFVLLPFILISLIIAGTWRIQYNSPAVQIARLSFLCVLFLFTLFLLFNCKYLSRFEMKKSKSRLFLLLPPVLSLIPALCILYVINYFLSLSFIDIGKAIDMRDLNIYVFYLVSVVFFLISIYGMFKKSVFFFCSAAQFFAALCSLHALYLMVSNLSIPLNIPYMIRIFSGLVPFALGLISSFLYFVYFEKRSELWKNR